MKILRNSSISWYLLGSMALLQILWLAGIYLTGASADFQKILGLSIYSLVSALIVLSLPEKLWMRGGQMGSRIFTSKSRMLLALCLLVIITGLVYVYFQRIWAWDEENNLIASSMIAEEGLRVFFENYSTIPWLSRFHPPLVPMINGFSMRVLGVSLISIRFVSLLFTLGVLITTYILGRELFDDDTGIIAAYLLVTFPLIFRLGTAALNDIQVSFFFTLGILVIVWLTQIPSYGIAVLAAICIGAGLLSKYTMVFFFPVLLTVYIANHSFRRLTPHLILIGVVSGAMLASWLLYASLIGALGEQSELVSQFEPGYFVSERSGINWMFNSILTKLPSAIGTYNLPMILLGMLVLLRRRSQADYLLLLWVITISVLLVFTLPDHRYFMPTFPAMALMMANWLKSRPRLIGPAIVLSFLYLGGALYLFVDWSRGANLFLR